MIDQQSVNFKEADSMPLAKEQTGLIKSQFEAWLNEMLPDQKHGISSPEPRRPLPKVKRDQTQQELILQH